MTVSIDLDVRDLLEGLREVENRIGQNVESALMKGADMIAGHAKSHHGYQDRSGALTASIASDGVTGSWDGGSLVASVSAGAPHAAAIEFGSKPHVIRPRHRRVLRWPVEGGFAFAKGVRHPGTEEYAYLEQALQAKQDDVAAELEAGVELAFVRAGL